MKLEEILDEWGKDSAIDQIMLDNTALTIAKMHHKYYSVLSRERLRLSKLEAEMKTLKLDKYEFYVDGPTQEQIEKGWKLPAKGKIIRSDSSMYLEADQDIIRKNLELAYQREKLEVLESIIKTINNLGFHVKTAVDFRRMSQGQV